MFFVFIQFAHKGIRNIFLVVLIFQNRYEILRNDIKGPINYRFSGHFDAKIEHSNDNINDAKTINALDVPSKCTLAHNLKYK